MILQFYDLHSPTTAMLWVQAQVFTKTSRLPLGNSPQVLQLPWGHHPLFLIFPGVTIPIFSAQTHKPLTTTAAAPTL